ncbi:hypothetical protein [uncultured Treponema sp.]|uniref:hypothetical protein n=1 Tax=uncultured Treponema sp. TaxID=162155 RepID=UPI0025CCEA3F|nr:hypothetical protein [uncultured Treponema sp.]
MSESKKSFSPATLVGIALIVLAIIGAWHFSFMPLNAKNDAKGFNGDSNQSIFMESDDEDAFFSEMERLQLTLAIREVSEKLKMNIIVFASRTPVSDEDTREFADSSYDEIYGKDTDGIFYYLDMSGKRPAYDYLSTSGKAVLFYQEKKENIFSKLDNYLPASYEVAENGYEPYREDIKKAILVFLDELEYYAETFDEKTSYFQSPNTGKYLYYLGDTLYVTYSRPPKQRFMICLFALLLGFIVSRIFAASVKKEYVFVTPVEADIYISKEKSEFNEMSDTFLREHTSKRHHSSSSSGGHSGGGHSGGGSHGGGGHHR